MTVNLEGLRLSLPLQATESGHLVLPIDNWNPETAREEASASILSFHNSQQLEDAYRSIPFPEFDNSETLEEFLELPQPWAPKELPPPKDQTSFEFPEVLRWKRRSPEFSTRIRNSGMSFGRWRQQRMSSFRNSPRIRQPPSANS